MFANCHNRKYKLLVIITTVIAMAVVVAVLLWPSGPKKPAVIPLGDYSHTIEYVDYQINKLMKNHNLPSVVVALIDGQDVVKRPERDPEHDPHENEECRELHVAQHGEGFPDMLSK